MVACWLISSVPRNSLLCIIHFYAELEKKLLLWTTASRMEVRPVSHRETAWENNFFYSTFLRLPSGHAG